MLPYSNRIRLNREFARIFEKGQTVVSQHFLIKAVPNDLMVNRFGFIVSNKVAKKATVRNRLKRQLRAIVAQNLSSLGVNGVDFALVARRTDPKLGYRDILNEVLILLKKIEKFYV